MSRGPALSGEFRQRVYEIVRAIPYGQVATYGDVALLCGLPRAARQVGWALHTLPDALVWGAAARRQRASGGSPPPTDAAQEAREGRVPWHRVINAQGSVSTHPDQVGTRRQIELLREEGFEVSDDGALVTGWPDCRWRPDPATIESLALPAEVIYTLAQRWDE
jgi:methylated-DNA-protein-cysteine methyltransferase-like protein